LVPALRPTALPQIVSLASDPSPAVQLQVALTLSDVDDQAAEQAVANLLTDSHAEPALMEDAVLSGMRGRELSFAQRLSKMPQWRESTPERIKTFIDLARCVMAEHRPSYVKHLIDLTASRDGGGWQQLALLEGMVPRTLKSSKATTQPAIPLKLIYLDEEPASLNALVNSSHGLVKSRAARVSARLAWPRKVGVPPPPVVIPLTPPQQAQFDRGKIVFSQLCAACHQPTGLGQDGLAPPLVDSEWVLGTDHRLVRIVLKGLTGSISVGGVNYRLEMPALTVLPDEDIAAALTYVRREWEHDADPVNVETVREIRKEIEDRNDPWTAEELLEVK
jgi:mono/diheme cytochrome c family protein